MDISIKEVDAAHDLRRKGDVMQSQIHDERMRENLQMIAKLRLMDDDLMRLVFDKNVVATELLLNIVLQRTDLKVLEVVAQREYKNPMVGGRSITIDIYAKDKDDKVYGIEVQRADRGAGCKRARFHSSMIDTKMLKARQGFDDIHESYVIFITERDVLGAGLPLYHVDRVIKEMQTDFEDGSHIIYVNGAYKNDEEPIGKLMHDFRCTSSVDMFYSPLAESMRFFKETDGGKESMCRAFEELAEKRAKEAAEEAAKQKSVEIARRMLLRGETNIKQIAEDLDLSIEEVETVKDSLKEM